MQVEPGIGRSAAMKSLVEHKLVMLGLRALGEISVLEVTIVAGLMVAVVVLSMNVLP